MIDKKAFFYKKLRLKKDFFDSIKLYRDILNKSKDKLGKIFKSGIYEGYKIVESK